MKLKLSRSYFLGLGSGFIISALISLAIICFPVHIQSSNTDSDSITQQSSESGVVDNDLSGGITGIPNDDVNKNEENLIDEKAEDDSVDNTGDNTGDNTEDNLGDNSTEVSQDIPPEEIETKYFTIYLGDKAVHIADRLVRQQIIKPEERTKLLNYIYENDLASNFIASTYELNTGMTIEEIVEKMIRRYW